MKWNGVLISFPRFPENSVVAIGIPSSIQINDKLEIDFSNLIRSAPRCVFFYGPNADKWEDRLDWTIVMNDVNSGQVSQTIMTISESITVQSLSQAYDASDYMCTESEEIFCYYEVAETPAIRKHRLDYLSQDFHYSMKLLRKD